MKTEAGGKHLKTSKDVIAVNILGILVIGLFALLCLFPFYLIIVASFTNENDLIRNGFPIIPRIKDISLEAYKLCLKEPDDIVNAYLVTGCTTIAGTCLSVFISTMTGYVLSRKDFPWRNKFSFFFFFTTLFSGGLVPWYLICVRYLHLKNSFLALLLPLLFSVWNMIIAKSFMAGVPARAISESMLDGGQRYADLYQADPSSQQTPGCDACAFFRAVLLERLV